MNTMPANLAGRLRNTPLPLTCGLLPLFEAVVNSIHAIEDANGSDIRGQIRVEILRKADQGELALDEDKKRGPEALPDIIGFTITDNGVGFTDPNMDSFRTLDSDYKADKGCRGIGRLLWLKAFNKVEVSSVFATEGESLSQRTFSFDAQSGISKEKIVNAVTANRKTTIHLDGFVSRYRDHARKSARAIGDCILEHCLWYFVREGGAPEITVSDRSQGESITMDTLYDEHMHASAVSEDIKIKERDFSLIHVKFRAGTQPAHAIALCADNRLVLEEKISGKIPGLHGRLTDDKGAFVYICYVSSTFLDETAHPQRTGFDVLDNTDGLFADTEITRSDIQESVMAKAAEHLSEHLEQNKTRAKERVDDFVAKRAPRYRPIMKRIPPEKLDIDPNASDKDIDLMLHRHLAEIEGQLLDAGHEIMAPAANEGLDEYKERLAVYLKTAEDIKKSDLANYVSHRRVILDLLARAIQRDEDGKYQREDLIHNLIMPMQNTSDDVMLDSCNLWLVDERLAFHDFLASDKSLASMPVTESTVPKEPDILALNVFDNPILVSEETSPPLASIVVVEIKRPMRNDASSGEKDDPIEQAIGYLDRIRSGSVRTKNGRPIPKSESIPGYCYILADLTPAFDKRCRLHHDLIATSDGLGYFGYKANSKAYVEVVSFDRLVRAAQERNRAFFDKLGLPT